MSRMELWTALIAGVNDTWSSTTSGLCLSSAVFTDAWNLLDEAHGVQLQVCYDMSKYLSWKRFIVPGPEVELFDKEVPHHTLHLAEARGEGRGLVSEGFDEACLVLLSEQTKDERFLTRLNYFMSTVHKDA